MRAEDLAPENPVTTIAHELDEPLAMRSPLSTACSSALEDATLSFGDDNRVRRPIGGPLKAVDPTTESHRWPVRDWPGRAAGAAFRDVMQGAPEILQDRLARLFAGSVPVDLVCVYLFGSHAARRPHRESDVDVGVLLPWDRYPKARDRFAAREAPARSSSGRQGSSSPSPRERPWPFVDRDQASSSPEPEPGGHCAEASPGWIVQAAEAVAHARLRPIGSSRVALLPPSRVIGCVDPQLREVGAVASGVPRQQQAPGQGGVGADVEVRQR